jgi:hypothetical protein
MRDRYEPNPAATDRDNGLRRLSRLTWRSAQLSAFAAAAFAILFARTAPTHSASSQAPVQPAHSPFSATGAAPKPLSSTSPAASASATGGAPTPQPSAAAPAPKPSSAAAPPPTLAPPTTPPAPAPAPSPVQSTSSGSHSG